MTTRKEALLQGALIQELNCGDLMSPKNCQRSWHSGITYVRVFIKGNLNVQY